VTNDRAPLPARGPCPGGPAVASDLGLSPRLVTPGEVFDSSLSPRTLAAYARTWEQWRTWCLGLPIAWEHGPPTSVPALLCEISAMGKPRAAGLAGQWLTKLRDLGRSASTLAAYARAITSVTRHAYELEIIPFSLVGVVKAPRGVRVSPARRVSLDPQILWETAQRASEDALTADTYRARLYGAIVATLADTAIRTVELLRLKRADVLSEGPEGGPVLCIRGKGRMSAPFLQPCSKRAYMAILGCTADGIISAAQSKASIQSDLSWSFDDWALVHPKGSRSKGDAAQLAVPGQLTRGIVRQAVDAYFPGMAPHDLRHARLTAWADAGVPLHVLQKAARHASPATTAGYLDTTAARVAELVASLDREGPSESRPLAVEESP